VLAKEDIWDRILIGAVAKVGMRSEQPINAMLPANNPAPMATADSVKFQPSVKYSVVAPTRS
jgi:hypothetical protein